MKLYYSPGACSFSPHVVLRELGLPFELERVDLRERKTASGADYRQINPKGYVPALQLDDGQVLTECVAIVQYLADRKPEAHLAPQAGTLERYRLQEWLNYIATELHKGFSPLFNKGLPDEVKATQKEALTARLAFVARQLEGRSFLLGDQLSVADAYLFTILAWTKFVRLDLTTWPTLQAYCERIGARPSVRAALEAEGLAD